jgi:hypothetical protein
MPKLEAIVTAVVNQRIVEARCSLCHEVILARERVGSVEDQDAELREAIQKHASQRHSVASE